MTKLTAAHIRDAMNLNPDVQITLGSLDEPNMPGIVIIGEALYTYRQHGTNGVNVVLSLQFCGVPISPFRYPSTVQFSLMTSADEAKIKRMQVAVSEFVETLQIEGDHDGAAKIAALLTLAPEDLISVHDALALGLTRDASIKSLTGADEPPTLFHVYEVVSTDNGSSPRYACGPARPGSSEVLWRTRKSSAYCYTTEAVEALRAAYPARTLHTQEV